jgi:hypothetical protein
MVSTISQNMSSKSYVTISDDLSSKINGDYRGFESLQLRHPSPGGLRVAGLSKRRATKRTHDMGDNRTTADLLFIAGPAIRQPQTP